MQLSIRTLVLVFAIAASAVVARADLFQTIRVNVRSGDRVEVDGKWLTTGTMAAEIARLVKGGKRIEIEMYIPIGLNKAALKRVIDSCKQAGASAFQVAYKA